MIPHKHHQYKTANKALKPGYGILQSSTMDIILEADQSAAVVLNSFKWNQLPLWIYIYIRIYIYIYTPFS